MDKSIMMRSIKAFPWKKVLKNICFYAIVPLLLLWVLAQPITDTVRLSNTAVFLILPAGFCFVALNWFVYRGIQKMRPSLLVFAHGILYLLAVVIIEHEALSTDSPLTSLCVVFFFPKNIYSAGERRYSEMDQKKVGQFLKELRKNTKDMA